MKIYEIFAWTYIWTIFVNIFIKSSIIYVICYLIFNITLHMKQNIDIIKID